MKNLRKILLTTLLTTGMIISLGCLPMIDSIPQAIAATSTSFWQSEDKDNKTVIDHSLWHTVLENNIVRETGNDVNLFQYNKITTQDKRSLTDYIASLQKIDPRILSRKEQLPYWVNLYNALTVNLILKHYPVKSIRDLGDSFFSRGPWDDKSITIAKEDLTLNDIEHKILRPIWKDPKIHYAVNCASISCPNLAKTAYTSENSEALLNQGARDYINSTRGVTIESTKRTKTLQLSSIYKWYVDDFGGNEKKLIEHLLAYANPDLKKVLQDFSGKIRYDYNWNLNGTK